MILAEACGNTFLIYEMSLGETLEQLQPEIVSALIEQKRDSGLVLERMTPNTWKMYVLEKDGSISSFCGNGARSVARYFWQTYGLSEAYLSNLQNKTCLVECREGSSLPSVRIEDVVQEGLVCYVLGEPHIIHRSSSDCIEELAKQHSNVNVSCIEPLSSHRWRIVTQERGVNAVTQSCGSGCVAAMHALISPHKEKQEIVFVCPGGENRVLYQNGVYFLEGPASCETGVLSSI